MTRFRLIASLVFALPVAAFAAPNAYITNYGDFTGTSTNGSVTVVDTATRTVVATISSLARPQGVAVNPNKAAVYVCETGTNKLLVIDTGSNTVSQAITLDATPDRVAVSHNGAKIYVSKLSGFVEVLDSTSFARIANISVGTAYPAGDWPSGLTVLPNNSKVYVTIAADPNDTVKVIDATSNTVTATIAIGGYAREIVASPDSTKVYVGTHLLSGGDFLRVIDTSTNAFTSVATHLDPYAGITVLPDGSKVYVSTLGGTGGTTVDVYDVASNTISCNIGFPSLSVQGSSAAPDGRVYVATTLFGSSAGRVDVVNGCTDELELFAGVNPQAFGNFIVPPCAGCCG